MPPEQAAGTTTRSGRWPTCIRSGAVLYGLLTGRPPFQAASPVETLVQVLSQEPVRPRQLNPAVPRDLETIPEVPGEGTGAALRTADELADELQRFLRRRADSRPACQRTGAAVALVQAAASDREHGRRRHPGLAGGHAGFDPLRVGGDARAGGGPPGTMAVAGGTRAPRGRQGSREQPERPWAKRPAAGPRSSCGARRSRPSSRPASNRPSRFPGSSQLKHDQNPLTCNRDGTLLAVPDPLEDLGRARAAAGPEVRRPCGAHPGLQPDGGCPRLPPACARQGEAAAVVVWRPMTNETVAKVQTEHVESCPAPRPFRPDGRLVEIGVPPAARRRSRCLNVESGAQTEISTAIRFATRYLPCFAGPDLRGRRKKRLERPDQTAR